MTITGWAGGVGFVALVVLAAGCSRSATLTLRSPSGHASGKTVGGDQETVLIEKRNARYSVGRENITDVSHPGTEAMIAGVFVVGVAVLLAYEFRLGFEF